jgi:hypothetical protein
MSQYDELYAQVPIGQLASRFGVDESEMSEAVRTALPALLGGLQANAQDPARADSLMRALTQHTGGVQADVDQVDVADGEKIVGHIYGDSHGQVMQQLGGLGGTTGSLVQKLLPILAPIVLSWLAGRLGGRGGLGGVIGDILGGRPTTQAPEAQSQPTDVESGPLFPGGVGAGSGPVHSPMDSDNPPAQAPASNPLQEVLGQVLGGSSGGKDILGGILGGLLGRGRR